jgi:hypothetical protein
MEIRNFFREALGSCLTELHTKQWRRERGNHYNFITDLCAFSPPDGPTRRSNGVKFRFWLIGCRVLLLEHL